VRTKPTPTGLAPSRSDQNGSKGRIRPNPTKSINTVSAIKNTGERIILCIVMFVFLWFKSNCWAAIVHLQNMLFLHIAIKERDKYCRIFPLADLLVEVRSAFTLELVPLCATHNLLAVIRCTSRAMTNLALNFSISPGVCRIKGSINTLHTTSTPRALSHMQHRKTVYFEDVFSSADIYTDNSD